MIDNDRSITIGKGHSELAKGAVIVVDIGKTLAKVTLWSQGGQCLDRQTRPNNRCVEDGMLRLDHAGIADWLVDALARYADEPVAAIVPVAHGAGVVALTDDGPAFAPLDYEQPIPDDVMAAYRGERDPFALTGSPALPDGLNIGSQLYWLDRRYPEAMSSATLVPWAQYWAWFLSGVAVSEVTSLGCHSDLWLPEEARFSPLADRQGWTKRFAPIVRADKAIGTLRPDLAARTGLSEQTSVLAGLHDSNAALLAARGFDEIAGNEATILSTGTWFIAMRLPGPSAPRTALPLSRDCLVNVGVNGDPVPSARFMGGREIETVIEIDTRRVDIKPDQPALLDAVGAVLASGAMMLPTLTPGCGPFPDPEGSWVNEPSDWHHRRAAMCLYAALVADTSLSLIGAQDRLLVEGRFAEAEVFVRALASLRPETVVYTANAHNDVSFGALRLVYPELKPQGSLCRIEPLDQSLEAYKSRWNNLVGEAH